MRFLALVLITSAIGLAGCTNSGSNPSPIQQVGCSVEQAVESGLAAAVASNLSCTNLPAITGDITAVIGKANLCPAAAPASASAQAKASVPKPKGAIADAVCPLAVDAVMGLAVNAIPASWGCTGGSTSDQLKVLITAACQKLPI